MSMGLWGCSSGKSVGSVDELMEEDGGGCSTSIGLCGYTSGNGV
jgi:hypothetical protein